MSVTLSIRDLRQLETQINEFLNTSDPFAYPIHQCQYHNDWLQDHTTLTASAILSLHTGIECKSEIRLAIQTANFHNGINKLISQRKNLIDHLKLNQRIVHTYEDQEIPMDGILLKHKVDQQIASAATGTENYLTDILYICTLSTEAYTSAKQAIKTGGKELKRIEGEMFDINTKSDIKLSDHVAQWLRETDLI